MDAPCMDDAPAAQPWSFVSMNMSLLPIARPLPVHTASPRRASDKPCTPSHQSVDKAVSISPRRQAGHASQSLRERVLRRDKVRKRDAVDETMDGSESDVAAPPVVRVKRILEILDEDRSVQDDVMHAVSPRSAKKVRLT
ncbi:hypothetical protein SPRG_08113 [Saprolegnia parasitica CBS 223.65]|uniref:Uncharacterized protein n=1 Tax=Saprolegnia parasitica (strain CBS 223.65) TaxID=695850 RepID=A0A067C8K0_SAPPC|nr:hypothetical protein SPRG_08113 [Saprolegnia parasitica CBS 223.65]KDO26823.1 hypothetical protein SPRG_08113 [Saprolegnia parasitica CBS 223.65]|eukprot:XP_012202471.1 hypothetical protein SPRG_08113 [Saprolegnia parasitica CBS 223.65]